MRNGLHDQSWIRNLQEVMAELTELVSELLELLALELLLAGASLVQIMALVVVTAILGTTAWLALCSGLGLLLVANGVSWPLALLAVLLVNLALAWAAVTRACLTLNLGLPATRRQLVFRAQASAAEAEIPPQFPPFLGGMEGKP